MDGLNSGICALKLSHWQLVKQDKEKCNKYSCVEELAITFWIICRDLLSACSKAD